MNGEAGEQRDRGMAEEPRRANLVALGEPDIVRRESRKGAKCSEPKGRNDRNNKGKGLISHKATPSDLGLDHPTEEINQPHKEIRAGIFSAADFKCDTAVIQVGESKAAPVSIGFDAHARAESRGGTDSCTMQQSRGVFKCGTAVPHSGESKTALVDIGLDAHAQAGSRGRADSRTTQQITREDQEHAGKTNSPMLLENSIGYAILSDNPIRRQLDGSFSGVRSEPDKKQEHDGNPKSLSALSADSIPTPDQERNSFRNHEHRPREKEAGNEGEGEHPQDPGSDAAKQAKGKQITWGTPPGDTTRINTLLAIAAPPRKKAKKRRSSDPTEQRTNGKGVSDQTDSSARQGNTFLMNQSNLVKPLFEQINAHKEEGRTPGNKVIGTHDYGAGREEVNPVKGEFALPEEEGRGLEASSHRATGKKGRRADTKVGKTKKSRVAMMDRDNRRLEVREMRRRRREEGRKVADEMKQTVGDSQLGREQHSQEPDYSFPDYNFYCNNNDVIIGEARDVDGCIIQVPHPPRDAEVSGGSPRKLVTPQADGLDFLHKHSSSKQGHKAEIYSRRVNVCGKKEGGKSSEKKIEAIVRSIRNVRRGKTKPDDLEKQEGQHPSDKYLVNPRKEWRENHGITSAWKGKHTIIESEDDTDSMASEEGGLRFFTKSPTLF